MDGLPPLPDEPGRADFRPAVTMRWQIIVLGIGLLMIAAAGLFALLRQPPVTETPDVQPIDFIETSSFSEAIVGQPVLVNPLLATSQADRDLVALVFSGLTQLDEYGQPIPDLAKDWEVSADGLTYTFHLRDDVVWHDGEPFTAGDVAFTMSLLRDPDFPGPADLAMFWRTVETYVLDDTTVEFVLTQPLSAFPEYAGVGILPAHLLAGVPPADLAEDSFNLSPVGTGRLKWVFSEVVDGVTTVHLAPHPDYYDAGRRVQLDEVSLRFYDEAPDAFRALGPDVQAMGGLTPDELNAALGSPNLSIYTARLPAYTAIIFNQQAPSRLPFFQEEPVRQALTASLDREAIVERVLPRQAVVAVSPLIPGTWAYEPDIQPIPYDPALAAPLLDEAGWLQEGPVRSREGVPLSFELLVSDRSIDQQIGETVVEQWRGLGVDARLVSVDADELLERLETPTDEGRDFDAALVEFSQGRLADPDPYPFWHESQAREGQNYSGLADRDISEALEIARRDPNGVRRAELYRSFQTWFVERAAAILLYNPVYHYAVSCQVEHVQLMIFVDPSDRFRSLHDWRIAPAGERTAACPG